MEIWILWTVIRIIVPLIILRWPLFGILLAAYVDYIDYVFLPLQTDQDFQRYQIWDKVLDTYYLTLAAYTSLSWKDKIAKRISIAAFFYRTVGVVIFAFTELHTLLFVFPNFFENFFIFYMFYSKIAKTELLFTTTKSVVIVIAAILIPKLIQEYFLHVLQELPREMIPYEQILPFDPSAQLVFFETIQWIAYLAIPIAALLWSKRQATLK